MITDKKLARKGYAVREFSSPKQAMDFYSTAIKVARDSMKIDSRYYSQDIAKRVADVMGMKINGMATVHFSDEDQWDKVHPYASTWR